MREKASAGRVGAHAAPGRPVQRPGGQLSQVRCLQFFSSRSRSGRRRGATTNANNSAYSELYACLCAYLDALAPGVFGPTATYHAAIVSKNSQCVWHLDKRNIRHAVLTALGHYKEGAELLVADDLRRTSYALSLFREIEKLPKTANLRKECHIDGTTRTMYDAIRCCCCVVAFISWSAEI